MAESLNVFQRWFWVSAILFLVYAALLILKIRRRTAWNRFAAAESEFWKRFGAPRAIPTFIRRFGESKLSTICLGVVTVIFALLTVLNAGAYLHFKDRLNPTKQRPASSSPRRP